MRYLGRWTGWRLLCRYKVFEGELLDVLGICYGISKRSTCNMGQKMVKINQASFSERVVPSTINYHREHPGLILMQDSAPAHRGRVLDELAGAGIELMEWPPFSPDLNPIENVWNIMKDKIQFYFPELNRRRLPVSRIHAIVQASWDLIADEHLTPLLASMHSRCQAVLDVNWGHTRFSISDCFSVFCLKSCE